jgi:hypothetical protein
MSFLAICMPFGMLEDRFPLVFCVTACMFMGARLPAVLSLASEEDNYIDCNLQTSVRCFGDAMTRLAFRPDWAHTTYMHTTY